MRSTDPPDPKNLVVHTDEWWTAVYAMYHGAAWRGVMSVYKSAGELRDSRGVEDVVQEVFEKLIESKSIDNDTKNIAGVVYVRARQRALDRTKRGRRTESSDADDRGEHDCGYDDVDEADLAERVGGHAHDNLHRLNPTERRVWALASNSDLSQAEIAARAGVSEGHVSTMLKKDIPRKLLTGFRFQQDKGGG